MNRAPSLIAKRSMKQAKPVFKVIIEADMPSKHHALPIDNDGFLRDNCERGDTGVSLIEDILRLKILRCDKYNRIKLLSI